MRGQHLLNENEKSNSKYSARRCQLLWLWTRFCIFIDNSYEGCHAQIILDLLPKAATALGIGLGCTYMYNEANRCIAAMYRICRQLHLKSETLNKEDPAFSDFEQRFFRSNNFSEKHKTF